MRIDKLPGGRCAIRSAFNPDMVAACKAVPGMVWDSAERAWVGYPDAIVEVDWPSIRRLTQPTMAGAFGVEPTPPILGDRGDYEVYSGLRHYQQDGVGFLKHQSSRGALLADVMGAGKSAQALRAAKALNQRTLIVCPSFVRGVWKKELEKWWPEASYGFLDGVKGIAEKSDIPPWLVVIVHYDILYAWVEKLKAWRGGPLDASKPGPKTLILDEGHYVSNGRSRRTKACFDIGAAATHRIALTGTPLTNRPRDLWALANVLSPGRFGTFFKFAVRYCGAEQRTVGQGASAKVVWEFGGRSHLDELNRRLKYFMLRRTHADINLELPALTRQVVELKVASKYKVDVERGVSAKAMRRALDLAADGKLKEIVSMCRQHVEDGHKVVVFCHRRAVAEHIAYESAVGVSGAASLFAPIHGGFSQAERTRRVEDFQRHEGPGLLAATIDIASVGIDLSSADVCVFAELTWEPHELAQAEARVYRFGAQKPILVQYCIAMGTGEELIRDRVIDKMKQTMEPTLGGREELATALQGGVSDEDALKALWDAL